MDVVITGATGLVGSALFRKLGSARVVSRDPERAETDLGPGAIAFPWEGIRDALDSADAVVHLSGAPVAARWTAARRRAIKLSRVVSTREVVSAIARLPAGHRPRVLVVASAVGIYGADRGDAELDERAPNGDDFLARVCAEWEAEALRAESLGVRVVRLRLGVVLAREGGALARMLLPFRLCLGGRLGSGRQFFPWIHIEDVVGLILHALENGAVSGAVNAVAPGAVRNAAFTSALARALGRPAVLPVPAIALKVLLGEMSSLLLGSQHVVPRMAALARYRFAFPAIEPALAELVGARRAPVGAIAVAPGNRG